MAVKVDRNVRSDPADDLLDEMGRRLRGEDADRVHDHDLLGACVERGLVGRLEEPELGARAVDCEVGYAHAALRGERDRGLDAAEHLRLLHAQRAELQVRDRRLDYGRLQAERHDGFDIAGHGPRETP